MLEAPVGPTPRTNEHLKAVSLTVSAVLNQVK